MLPDRAPVNVDIPDTVSDLVLTLRVPIPATPVILLPSPLNELATKVPATVAAPDTLISTKLPIPIVPIPLTLISLAVIP